MASQAHTLMDKEFKEHPCLVVVDEHRFATTLPSSWIISRGAMAQPQDDGLSRSLIDQLPLISMLLARNAPKFGLEDIHPGAHVVGVESLCAELFGKVPSGNVGDNQAPIVLPQTPISTISELRRALAHHPSTLRWLSGE
jgi:hypothetical protein